MQVSVVIPSYNGKKLLKKYLPKVLLATPGCELIVVDDASTDGSVIYLEKNFPQVKVIANLQNVRFAQSCNIGVKAASGSIIILLNNDVVPKRNFLPFLLKHFRDQKMFSVGCLEIEQRQGRDIISGRTDGTFKRGFFVHWKPSDQESSNTLWTIGGSMAVSRQKYLKLGGMDPLFAPAYWEDIDLCWRAREQGWKVLFEKNAIVWHQHESTNKSVFGKRQMEIMSYRNQLLFMWKNIRGVQLIKHFLWLPYHLVFNGVRSKGNFLIGFFQAINRYVFNKNQ